MSDAHYLSSLHAAHRRLLDVTAQLDDRAVAAPSRLPGWNRAMLLSHLRYGAEAQLRGVLAAASEGAAEMYPGGDAQRAAEIESGRQLTSGHLHSELADVCRRMEEAFASRSVNQWDAQVVSRRGSIPVREVLLQRWLDVEVHLIDLDVGHGIDELSDQLVDVYLAKLVAIMPALRRRPDADHGINGSWRLARSDGPDAWCICAKGADAYLCEQPQDPVTVITGTAKELFAVVLGRLQPEAVHCTDPTHASKFKKAFPGP